MADNASRAFRTGSTTRRGIALFTLLVLVAGATPAAAEEYDPKRSGHPLRILAYVVHPVGVVLDALIFRPAHWLFHYEPRFKKLVGQTD